MKNISERQGDILSIIRSLDISPSMYKNAVEKYQALGKFLNDNGIEAEIYPQGSFAFGTVVRPSTIDSSASYDLDFICQVVGSRDEYTPSGLRTKVENVLKSNKTYADRLEVCDKCFTIKYADIDEIGFSIDIVPAADESNETKNRLIRKSPSPELIDTSVAIPKCDSNRRYQWITNNPKGFRKWFNDINEPFLASSREFERQRIFAENKSIYASVEEIPSALERSALQRVIQILKCHRNNYYASIANGDEIKPISAIINTIVTRIAEHYNPDCTVFDLLSYVLTELSIYAEHQRITEKAFAQMYGARTVLSRPEGKWYIENPANPEDNLADQWNNDSRIPDRFFRWIGVAKKDLISSLAQDENQQFRAMLESSFGSTVVSGLLGKKYCGEMAPRHIVPQTAARPYGGQ